MKIEFIASDRLTELTVEPPVPAKEVVPDWYKNTPRYLNHSGPIFNNGSVSNNSIKACVPFFDALSVGYIQKTWCDIHIKFDYENDSLNFDYNYPRNPSIISHRDAANVPIPSEFHNVEFIWQIPWMPKTPKGWSCLFVSPFNRPELPFFSLSAIIDSDFFYCSQKGSYPFWIKKEFNNRIVPAGTPMYQIIPFKRKNWMADVLEVSQEERQINLSQLKSQFIGSYKKLFHQKKIYK